MSHPVALDDLAEIDHLVWDLIDRLYSPALPMGRENLESLTLALEVGEIGPTSALVSLPPRDAEVVRRLALASLRSVALRLQRT